MEKPARQVFVISDLHVGGVYADSGDPQDRGFRISTQVPQLTAFVTALADKQPGEPAIELVINGDFVDFLAERDSSSAGWQPFVQDPQAAARKLEAIVERDSALFAALGRSSPVFYAYVRFLLEVQNCAEATIGGAKFLHLVEQPFCCRCLVHCAFCGHP